VADNGKDTKQVDVGFSGGSAISMRLTDVQINQLKGELKAGGSWLDLDTQDGPVTIALGQVVFVKSESSEHRIGFSGL
jgi:hypothetical protein